MRDDLLVQQLEEALRRRGARPPEERFRDMVARGVIDEQGNVLLRYPMPPEEPATNGATEATPRQPAPPANDLTVEGERGQ